MLDAEAREASREQAALLEDQTPPPQQHFPVVPKVQTTSWALQQKAASKTLATTVVSTVLRAAITAARVARTTEFMPLNFCVGLHGR